MAPLGTGSYIIGKTLPYFVISLATSVTIVVASMVLFGLPMNGSWALLILALSLYLAGALGLGLMISTIAESQQVAFQIAVLASFLPTMAPLSRAAAPGRSMSAPSRRFRCDAPGGPARPTRLAAAMARARGEARDLRRAALERRTG